MTQLTGQHVLMTWTPSSTSGTSGINAFRGCQTHPGQSKSSPTPWLRSGRITIVGQSIGLSEACPYAVERAFRCGMKYRMLPRARSWVGWHAPAPCVVRECAGASLETGSFKARLGPSGPRVRTERTCLTCVLHWSVYWNCVLVVCPTWIRVSGSLLCVWRALPTELCVWRSRVCRRQVCLIKYGIWAYKGRMATVSGVHCR